MIYPLTTTVNSNTYTREVEPRLLLRDFLWHELGLTGTHVGCEHRVCGAFIVLLDGVPGRRVLSNAAKHANAQLIIA